MNNFLRIGLAAAAAVVIIAVIAINLLPGTPAPGSGPTPTSEPAAVEPTATPLPRLGTQELLAAGRYRMDVGISPIGSSPIEVTVEVPAGWGSSGDWVVIGPRGNDEPDGMAIRFYRTRDLYVDPLSPSDGLLDPPVGPSVEDLVNAMVGHPDWTTTGPEAITIDGYAGQVVHVTLPPGTSDATPFFLSVDARAQVWGWHPDQIFDIYVVDVDGERLVIDAFHYPNTSEEDLAAQQAVIDSIQLAPTL